MPLHPGTRILIVINPISGGSFKSDLEKTIQQYLSAHNYIIEFYELTGSDDAMSLKHWVSDWKPQVILAVGGDGTLKVVAEQAIDTEIIVGLLPAGSANGMARELGFPVDIEACLIILSAGNVQQIDVVKVNDDISIHLSDIGLNAQLVKYFEESGKRGKWGYLKEVGRVLMNKQQMKVKIATDRETITRDAFMVVVANASKYGTGALINPDGDLSDGLFELIIIRKISLPEIVKMMFNSKRLNKQKTEILQARKVTMSLNKKAHFQVDGEYKGKTDSIEAVICPKALHMILPEASGKTI